VTDDTDTGDAPTVEKLVADRSDESDAVDSGDARLAGYYGRFRDNIWHYVPDGREKVLVRLAPCALYELYIGTNDLSLDACQKGHAAACDLCGESALLEKAISNPRVTPCIGVAVSTHTVLHSLSRNRVALYE